ncbi:RsmB/NOP family class I SAM-dependent RNA methyltransferase [Candidatus Woesearchaeota archaeon]|nr:RsmB/NOP family class I SAM-dependent RNA methyltransferase [Candidatus Woesearchaeota archaeon]MBT5397106.1 RsmB/NOP family class I SAM-dependent RNA methyltransferase [Candidatus Woesearchaeota archaeon]MBT5924762.1 RsmB/NOP family class I SAM-dependent RNA methyltransferase [Candidatus Woesearchaeota archaeon]MBT6367348.1 RsmB/NOP family class I SAM-dependent RNA methyltransferase [Candidatus Woesearchaeota archaeon]MBT7762506.1 RsmB/NOP family class I SAM-dependent RNA methyltransferase 
MSTITPIPSVPEFKKAFIERYSELTDWDEFKKYSLSFLRRSIRINTLTTTIKETKKSIEAKGWILQQIPWCKEGFWISHPDRKDVGNLLEHHLGKIYVQEAASMIPPLVLQPQPGDIVLDMCAAPGSKTTQMVAMMKNEGVMVANDYKGQRLQSLGINIQRSGVTNTIITLMHGKRFHEFEFDKILVDAPCSGTGTIRKSLKTITIWNAGMISKLARQQVELLVNAFNNLKDGGELVYSTCSVEPEENEGVIHTLLERFDTAEVIPVTLNGLKTVEPIMEFKKVKYNPAVKDCIRIWPQDNDTEGFFVTKIRKKPTNE